MARLSCFEWLLEVIFGTDFFGKVIWLYDVKGHDMMLGSVEFCRLLHKQTSFHDLPRT